ncbi:MAG: sigma-54 dependent transcriptional regulator [Bryobacteraceae bacterium]
MMAKPDLQSFLGIETVIASEPMRDLLAMVQRISQTEASVLIMGESGSGKEVVARAIHHYSLRATKPWVDINCGALPEHLIESELFGYDKGAFSGADSNKPGLFELADKGTLFLDEIGELDPRMQVKLLRVLDRVPYFRLGGSKKVSVDVRILAATNRDLSQAISEGRFRSDLYHRLCQVRLRVPPLRERRGDIVPLARFFLRQQSVESGFDDDAVECLLAHTWPGNVRELRNVVTSAAVMALDGRIRAADLEIQAPEHTGGSNGSGAETPINLEELERQTILRALEQTGRHYERAASLLGISSRTLSRKLKSYGMAGVGGHANANMAP